MNLTCKLFGHKWDKKDKYRQPCKRKDCYVWRSLMIDRIAYYTWSGKLEWIVFNELDKI
ncbi:hypothetical protein COB55_03565 [Candidatus Wolfebacteria bacterium]|nr:MAG: hypothetical protein COB55_03565 [Candidatus Wolfebacteria bacterium]